MKIRVTTISEIEVPDEEIMKWYETEDREQILEMEKESYHEWILDKVVREKIQIIEADDSISASYEDMDI